jgi:hypothetical protein
VKGKSVNKYACAFLESEGSDDTERQNRSFGGTLFSGSRGGNLGRSVLARADVLSEGLASNVRKMKVTKEYQISETFIPSPHHS